MTLGYCDICNWITCGFYMAPSRLAAINDDILGLMGEADEGLWQEVGLFKTIDRLGKLSPNLIPSSSDASAHPARYLSVRPLCEGVDILPTYTDSLPSLSDSLPEVQHHTIRGNQSFEDRGGGFYGYSSKADCNTLPQWKYHRQWKSNKVLRRMVLGSDIGLEETCRMELCGLVGRFSYGNLRKEIIPI